MKTETRTLDWFLRDPRCRKWIQQCSACQQYGRKPETPETVPKFRFEEMFPIMDLDNEGLCQACRDATIRAAAGEKLAAMLDGAEYLRREASLGSRADFERVLAKVPKVPPEPYDKLD